MTANDCNTCLTLSLCLPPSLLPSTPFAVSSLMQEYPASSLFWGPYSLTLDEAAIAKYAEQLQPSNLQITLVDSALEAEAAAHPSEWSKEAW